MIAGRERADARADLDHDPRALVAEHHGKETLGVLARKCVGIGVTHAAGGQLDQALAGARSLELDIFDIESASGFPRHRRLHLHARDYNAPLTRV